jgi:hypothetical protein
LRFLRPKKYSLLNATKTLENYLNDPKLHPTYFKNLDVADPTLSEFFDSGFLLVLPERDEDGCRIVMIRPAAFDTEKFKAVDCFRAVISMLEFILQEEETQISGLKLLVDFADTPMKFFSLFTLMDFKNMVTLAQNSLSCRQKAYYFMSLPPYANQLLQFIVGLFNEKLRQRVRFVKDTEELKKYMDIDLLPQNYGGKITLQQNIKFLKDNLAQIREQILLVNDIEADFGKRKTSTSFQKDIENGAVVGSFRKLEID